MAAAEMSQDPTALRALEQRARGLPLSAQMSECIDLLQAPEIVVDDLLRSLSQIRDTPAPAARVRLVSSAPEPEEMGEGERPSQAAFFYPSRELFVQGDGCSFTCLATQVDFVEEAPAPIEAAHGLSSPIDYAGVTCEARPFPVLGFTQATDSDSAYPVLLRSLSNLIDLTRPRRFDLLDRDVYRGLLGPAPVFDLVLVLWDDDAEPDARRPLCELSRDLAEVLKQTLQAEPRFPPILNDIVCLRMNHKRFDGRLRFVWRV